MLELQRNASRFIIEGDGLPRVVFLLRARPREEGVQ